MTGQIVIAYVLDLVFGDPRWLPHPVVLMGKGVTFLEKRLLRPSMTRKAKRLAGCVVVVVLVFGTWLLANALLNLTSTYGSGLGLAVSIFLAYTTLATRSLHREATAVMERLKNDDIAGARRRLAALVSRDTQDLDHSGISRALVETVAENSSDGIVAPLFYLGIGGPALALAYKAINTLDSMVGYRNARYVDFGWASARLDDVANFIPARITVLLTVVVARVVGREWKCAFVAAWEEGRNHESPNAGFPEAAMAGALGVQLGGPSVYFGQVHKKPYIGSAKEPLSIQKVGESIQIMLGVSVAMVIGVALTRLGVIVLF
jgi:adenosylcobinamide-phosphate synthase